MNTLGNSNQFRPTQAFIDLGALRHNLKLAYELAGPGIAMMGVVKANGYGHGAVPVAQTLEAEGIEAMAVAMPWEALELRQAGIKTPLYLLAGPFSASGDFLREHQLTPVLFNIPQVKHLQKSLTGKLKIHLKLDTGMTRLGVLPKDLGEMLQALRQASQLELGGVLTHLASADETFEGPTEKQFQVFSRMEATVRKEFPEAQFFHVANSAAILGKKLGGCNWARPGIMLYGSNPHPRFKEGERLKPVMHFKTQIISLKEVPAGSAVSYGGEWVASRPSRIGVLPVGYADGYIRHLGNGAEVLIEGRRVPVVGRVCMDLTMVDLSDCPGMGLGEEVTLWGPGLPAEEVANKGGTISYELFCGVGLRVPRIYQGGGVT